MRRDCTLRLVDAHSVRTQDLARGLGFTEARVQSKANADGEFVIVGIILPRAPGVSSGPTSDREGKRQERVWRG